MTTLHDISTQDVWLHSANFQIMIPKISSNFYITYTTNITSELSTWKFWITISLNIFYKYQNAINNNSDLMAPTKHVWDLFTIHV